MQKTNILNNSIISTNGLVFSPPGTELLSEADQSIRLRKSLHKQLSGETKAEDEKKSNEEINLSQSFNFEESANEIDITNDTAINIALSNARDNATKIHSINLEMQAGSVTIGPSKKKQRIIEMNDEEVVRSPNENSRGHSNEEQKEQSFDICLSARRVLKQIKREEQEDELEEIARELENPNLKQREGLSDESESDDSFFGDEELDRDEKITLAVEYLNKNRHQQALLWERLLKKLEFYIESFGSETRKKGLKNTKIIEGFDKNANKGDIISCNDDKLPFIGEKPNPNATFCTIFGRSSKRYLVLSDQKLFICERTGHQKFKIKSISPIASLCLVNLDDTEDSSEIGLLFQRSAGREVKKNDFSAKWYAIKKQNLSFLIQLYEICKLIDKSEAV